VAGAASYGRTLTLTLSGSNLDQGVSVAATGCTGVAIVAASSSATTAKYQCAVSALGSGQFVVTASSGGATLATASFTVPAPQVTINYSNSNGVTGAIILTLTPDKTPITVNNFLSYVNSGFYAGTVIHRVSPGFVIQGGGYTAPFDATTQNLKATNAPIALEVGKGLSNTQWTIAMARTSDPASATSQFFINLADNSGTLDPGSTAGYAVFGSVTGAASTASVSNIAAAPCVALPLVLPTGDCAPTPNVVITSATQTL
jgi:cyclophilin family peptidyl-prolyl cis-trans isomerase